MSNRVIHFEIQADDPARAAKFYHDTFGWETPVWMTKEKSGMMDYWGLVTGKDGEPGINGGLYKRPAENKLTTFDCTISVEDIDAAIEAVKKNGGKILREKMKLEGVGFFARCQDTEDNIFALMQPTEWKTH